MVKYGFHFVGELIIDNICSHFSDSLSSLLKDERHIIHIYQFINIYQFVSEYGPEKRMI